LTSTFKKYYFVLSVLGMVGFKKQYDEEAKMSIPLNKFRLNLKV